MATFLRALCIVFFATALGGCLGSDLHNAVSEGNVNEVRNLLDRGADVNATDLKGHTPLHFALANNQAEIAAVLIEAGADMEAADIFGQTLREYAIANGHVETAIVLIKSQAAAGIDLNAPPIGDMFPYHWAVEQGMTDIALGFIAEGVQVDTIDKGGNTALHIAAREGHAETIATLIKRARAYPDTKNQRSETPLHIAIVEGNTEAALALVEGGANINVKNPDKNEDTPLHLAAKEGQTETALALIEAGADTNATNFFGLTPLATAKNEHGEKSDIVLAIQNAGK